MKRSLLWRTALQISGVIGAVLLAFGVLLWWGVATAWQQALDQGMRSKAHAAAALCEWEEGEGHIECDLTEPRAVELGFGPESGISIWQLEPETASPLFAFGALPAQRNSRTDDEPESSDFRRLEVVLPVGESPTSRQPQVRILVATRLAPLTRRTEALLRYLACLGLLCLGLGAALGTALARRILHPVQQLHIAAERIANGEPIDVPRTGRGDELDGLADALGRAFRTQADSTTRQARFTADAAHELRNPIAAIRARAEVALHRNRSADEVRESLLDISRVSERMGQLVEAMLELARLDASGGQLAVEEICLRSLVAEIVAGENITARVPELRVSANRRMLEVLIRNLVANAKRHARSRVELTATREAGNAIALTVRDDGPGFGIDAPQRLVERFRRSSPATQGSGLGLAICAQVVEAHGGAISLRTLAVGAQVEVTLPQAHRH